MRGKEGNTGGEAPWSLTPTPSADAQTSGSITVFSHLFHDIAVIHETDFLNEKKKKT